MKRLITCVYVLALGCGPTGTKPLNSEPNNQQPNSANVTPNNTNNVLQQPESLSEVVLGFTEGASVAADFTSGLKGDGDQLQGEMRDGPVANDRAQGAFENGVSGNSVVDEPTCVTYTWGEGLQVVVVFDGCVAEQSGETIDGTLQATLAFRPVTFGLVLEDLAVGATTFNGTLDLAFGDNGGVNADLQFDTAEGSTALTLSNLTIALPEGGGVAFNGSGTVTNTKTTSFDVDQVAFATGDCLPSSGTLSFEDGGNPVTATFLPTTPTAGTVLVTWPPLVANPTEMDVLPPCDPM